MKHEDYISNIRTSPSIKFGVISIAIISRKSAFSISYTYFFNTYQGYSTTKMTSNGYRRSVKSTWLIHVFHTSYPLKHQAMMRQQHWATKKLCTILWEGSSEYLLMLWMVISYLPLEIALPSPISEHLSATHHQVHRGSPQTSSFYHSLNFGI